MEKLWTTTEAARFLGVPEDDVSRFVKEGRLTGYKLAGQFLRFKPEQVQALKGRMPDAAQVPAATATASSSLTWIERVRTFIYFYDFYLLSFLLLTAVVLYLISAT